MICALELSQGDMSFGGRGTPVHRRWRYMRVKEREQGQSLNRFRAGLLIHQLLQGVRCIAAEAIDGLLSRVHLSAHATASHTLCSGSFS